MKRRGEIGDRGFGCLLVVGAICFFAALAVLAVACFTELAH